MRVLVWVFLWALLLAGSGWYLRGRLRAVWRRAEGLARELERAQARLDAARTAAEGARERPADPAPAELAAFGGIARAYRERVAVRAALDEHRRARRAQRLPGWARRVDS